MISQFLFPTILLSLSRYRIAFFSVLLFLVIPLLPVACPRSPHTFLNGKEPIVGKLLRNITGEQLDNSMAVSGQIQVYQILRLELKSPEIYQTIELDITPALISPENSSPTLAVSLMAYGQVQVLDQKDSVNAETLIFFQGNRILTRGLLGQSYIRFALRSASDDAVRPSPVVRTALPRSNGLTNLSNRITQNGYNSQYITVESQNFPIYIVLYPLQAETASANRSPAQPSSAELSPVTSQASYHYRIQYKKKDYGYVRFRLLANQSMDNTSEAAQILTHLSDPNLLLNLQIDERSYTWSFDPSFRGSQKQQSSNNARYSEQYIVKTGQHNVQVNSQKYYARTQFRASPGSSQVVTLQLQERLSQLELLVPKNAAILLDGIPLQKQKDWTPTWQNVQVEEVESYHYEQLRLRYQLSLPVGKHHMLIQYEGSTWEREIFCQEGVQQSFQLNWELHNNSQAQIESQ